MKCRRCQQENPPQANFCLECATPLPLRCANCGTQLLAGAKFCVECANPVAGHGSAPRLSGPEAYTPKHLAETILTSRSALEGERKQVTVVFCDIVGSTALAERLGLDAMHALLDRFFDLALAEVHRYEGTVNQFLGDGFMALFGAPVAHEDHAHRAVLAALALQRVVQKQRREGGVPGTVDFAVRMGINTGPVIVGKIGDSLRMDYTAVGDTTNLAARLQHLAQPGAVYVTESTWRAVQGFCEWQRLGPKTLKGIAEPTVVYRVLAARSEAAPEALGPAANAPPLVERETEMALLWRSIENLSRGRGGFVLITGDAGLGKSRLLAELRRQVAAGDLLWLQGRSVPFGQTLSYLPFVSILRGLAGVLPDDREDVVWGKLQSTLASLFPDDLEEILPYLATLLALEVPEPYNARLRYLDRRAMGGQIFRAARRLFDRAARRQPVVLVVEDLHWIDESSAELLAHLLPLVGLVPLLILSASRPDSDRPALRLLDAAAAEQATHCRQITLAPLSTSGSAELVRGLLGTEAPVGRLGEFIASKAEGNPFFVEEVVRTLIETKVLVRAGGTTAWGMATDVARLTIPDTIQGVIAARIDRLPEEAKQTLKLAAVIGRHFPHRILQEIAEQAEPALTLDLARLQAVDLVRATGRLTEHGYVFKHALVQEVAYESILLPRRRELHRAAGRCIERLYADRLEEFFGILAYHYAQAEDWEPAQRYLLSAGDQAGRLAADAEALAHYRQAVVAYERVFGARWDPLERAALDRKIGEALFGRGRHEDAIEYLRRALARLGGPSPRSRWGVRLALGSQVLRQVGHRWMPHFFLPTPSPGDIALGKERSRICEAMAWIDYFVDQERFVLDALLQLNFSERSRLQEGIVRGTMALGVILDHVPLLALSRRYHRRGVALAETMQHPVALAFAYFGLAMHEHHALGETEAALAHYRQAAQYFRASGDLRRWGASTYSAAWVLRLRGRLAESLNLSRELMRVGQDGADDHVLAWGLHATGRGLAQAGAVADAIARVAEARELFRHVPDLQFVACTTSDLAQYQLRLGRLDEALRLAEDARHLIAERGFRGFLCTPARNAFADVCLELAASAPRLTRAAVRRARRACRASLRQGELNPEGLPTACRLAGRWEWRYGRRSRAWNRWRRGLAAAEALGACHEIALLHHEIGTCAGDPDHLARAREILDSLERDRAAATNVP